MSKAQAWKRPLIGCAIGCGTLMVLMIVVGVAGYFWAVSPGAQVPTQDIMGPQSVALLRLDHPGQDEGVKALATDILLDLQKMDIERQRRELPPFLQWIGSQPRSSPDDIVEQVERELPKEITVTLEEVDDQEGPALVAAINLARYPKLIRFFIWMSSSEENTETHEESQFLSFEGGSVTFVDNTLLWSTSSSGLRLALDRMKKPELESSVSSPLISAYRSSDPRWDLYTVVDNRSGSLQGLLKKLQSLGLFEDLPAETASQLETVNSLWLGVDVVSRELVESQLRMECRTPADAARWRDLIQEWTSNGTQSDTQLTLTTKILLDDRNLDAEIQITNIKEALSQVVKRLGDNQADE